MAGKEQCRAGAPDANRNATKHGLRANRLPPGTERLAGHLKKLQADLEAAIIEREGEVDIYHAALVQSAIRHERACYLMWRWLRLEGDTMKVDQRVSLLANASVATEKRDKALKLMGLDKRENADIWSDLDSPNQPSDPPEPSKILEASAEK